MNASVDTLMSQARPRVDALDRDRIAAEVYEVLFGRRAPEVAIGRFVVESRLGSGGMGIVYRGYDPELDRRVAIKVLDLRRLGTRPASAHARLLREARALARLTHPNVVAVHDVGVLADDGDRANPEARLYLVMEYVDGPTVRRWMRDDHDLDARLALLLDAGRGLAAAHDTGLIHGDFKPDNILVGRDGRPRVADFGLALPILALDRHTPIPSSELEPRMSLTGVFGTPAYIAPEQHLGRAIDARADQFSFCVVACELLLGRRPFVGDSIEALAAAAFAGEMIRAGRRIPRKAAAVLRRGLAADPCSRFRDMHELLTQLEAAFDQRRRRRWLLGSALVVCGAGAATVAILAHDPPSTAAPETCTSAERRLEPIWTKARADAIAARLRTGDRLGASSADVIVDRLDDQARSWARAWTDSCKLGTDEATRERMRTCLDARLSELDTVVAALADPERDPVAPLALLEQLTPVATCLDGASLDAARPVPLERSQRHQVEIVRNQLIGKALLAAPLGRHEQAIALARQAVARAEQLGFRPLVAEAQLALAVALQSANQPTEAVDMAERAHLSAQASRHAAALADAAVLRVSLAYDQADMEAGRAWLAKAEAANEATGGDSRRAVQLRGAACMFELLAGSYDAALDECERAQGLIDRGARVDAATRLRIGCNFAIAEQGAGLLERADRRFAAVEQGIRTELGSNHPWLSRLSLNWGHVAFDLGDPQQALARYRHALELLVINGLDQSVSAGTVVVNIADALLELGRLDEAELEYRRAIELVEAADDYWTLHVARNGLARVAMIRGDARAAFDAWSQQLAQEHGRLEPSHPWVLELELNLGSARAMLGEVDEGLAQIDAVIVVLEREFGPDHVELADDLRVRALVARDAGRWQQCIADLDRVRAIEIARAGAGSRVVAAIEVERSACRLGRGDDPTAVLDELEPAVETIAGGPLRAEQGLARFVLGRVHMSDGDLAAARVQLEHARELLEAEQGDYSETLATIATLLDQR